MKQEMLDFYTDVRNIFDEYLRFSFQMSSNGFPKEQNLTAEIEVRPNKYTESIEVVLRSLYGGMIKGETRFFGQSFIDQEVNSDVEETLVSIPFSDYYQIDSWKMLLIEDIGNYITNSTIHVPIYTDKDIPSTEAKKVYKASFIG